MCSTFILTNVSIHSRMTYNVVERIYKVDAKVTMLGWRNLNFLKSD